MPIQFAVCNLFSTRWNTLPAEQRSKALAARDDARRIDGILQSDLSTTQKLAASGLRLQSRCKTFGDQQGCRASLQWELQALVGPSYHTIQAVLVQVCYA